RPEVAFALARLGRLLELGRPPDRETAGGLEVARQLLPPRLVAGGARGTRRERLERGPAGWPARQRRLRREPLRRIPLDVAPARGQLGEQRDGAPRVHAGGGVHVMQA